MSKEQEFIKVISRITYFMVFVFALIAMLIAMLGYYVYDPALTILREEEKPVMTAPLEDPDRIENGIHVRTGLKDAEGLMAVVNNCTGCHSSKIITQNRMNEERWIATIKWMQETQNLWDLGANQEIIVKYLVTNYPPKKKGRRENLEDIDWYVLE